MSLQFYIGTIAAVFTTGALIPQAVKARGTKHTKDISLVMFLMTSFGVALWAVYGIMIGEMPVIVANTIVLVLNLYIVYLKILYG